MLVGRMTTRIGMLCCSRLSAKCFYSGIKKGDVMTGTSLINRLNGMYPRREDLLAPFESHFNKLFDEFFNEGSLSSIKGRANYPKIDVISEKDKWIVMVAAPETKVHVPVPTNGTFPERVADVTPHTV